MFTHSHHRKLTSIAAEIASAIDVMEGYRNELANPGAKARWHGIWLTSYLMLEWLFEEKTKHLYVLDMLDWVAVADEHATVMVRIRAMIEQCKSDRAHRRANLDALDDIILMLTLRKACYTRMGGTPTT
ncbi:MAG: hypothetical protein EPN20_06940, partial [Magnetospirillum sp.]